MTLFSKQEFFKKWKIDLGNPTLLVTLHPETIALTRNYEFARTVASVLEQLTEFQVIITMPNSDTEGSVIRKVWQQNFTSSNRVLMIENFGTKGYFSCMRYCSMLLGNTSSGIIEAASLHRYVINLGERQKGRARGSNVFDCDFDEKEIISLIRKVTLLPEYSGDNMYWKGGAVDQVIRILKESTT
jgi:GDP/UDP-N,N'-diacetylbacillosamine 2-epimerase (hydrolysing)